MGRAVSIPGSEIGTCPFNEPRLLDFTLPAAMTLWLPLPGTHDSAISVYRMPLGPSSGSLSEISIVMYSSDFPMDSAMQSTLMTCWPPGEMEPNPGYTENMPREKRACKESPMGEYSQRICHRTHLGSHVAWLLQQGIWIRDSLGN